MRRQAPTGIRARHAQACRSRGGGTCSCRPSYEAWVWSKRHGRKIRRTFPTLAAAKGWRAYALGELKRGRLAPPTRRTFAQAAEELKAGMRDGTIRRKGGELYKPSTIGSYERALDGYLVPEFGQARLDAITRNDFEDFAARIKRQHRRPDQATNLDGSSIANILMPARVIYRRAIRRGEVAVNPTHDLELPAPGRRKRRVAPAKEFRAFLSQLSVFDRALWSVAYFCGLRLGEVLALEWPQVDLAEGMIEVKAGWYAEGHLSVDPKSRPGFRRIAMTSELREYLADHRASSEGDGFVFAGAGGRPIAASTVHRRGRKAAAAAGVPWTPPHAARKTYGSLLRAAGVDDKGMATMMGHSSVVTTKDVYTSLLPGDERRIAEQLEAFLNSSP